MSSEPTRLYATLVDRLSDVPGVVATAAFDHEGECLACVFGSLLEPLGAGRVIPILQELAAPTDAATPFEEGVTFVEKHLVRVLLRRAANATFIVLIEPDADVDLVVAHVSRAVEQVARASRPPSMNAAATPSTPNVTERTHPSGTIAPPPSLEALNNSSGFYAKEASEEHAGSAEKNDDPHEQRQVDPEMVQRLRAMADDALGFASEVVFERAKASVGIEGSVPRSRWVELVGRIAGEIEDDDARERFVSSALVLPTRTRESDALDQLSPLARWVVERRSAG